MVGACVRCRSRKGTGQGGQVETFAKDLPWSCARIEAYRLSKRKSRIAKMLVRSGTALSAHPAGCALETPRTPQSEMSIREYILDQDQEDKRLDQLNLWR